MDFLEPIHAHRANKAAQIPINYPIMTSQIPINYPIMALHHMTKSLTTRQKAEDRRSNNLIISLKSQKPSLPELKLAGR